MDPLREFFENLAFEWDSGQPEGREKILHQLLTPFDEILSDAKALLEVGTGTGALISILKERYPTTDVTSIDLAHHMLTRTLLREPTAQVVQSDVHFLPFEDGIFDTVVCHNSFPHFASKSEAIRSLKRTLKSGGSLLIFHDTSRERVNSIHQNALNPIIHQDLLPDGSTLSKMLINENFEPLFVDDNEQYYIIYAKYMNYF